jgi:hypothetical protein
MEDGRTARSRRGRPSTGGGGRGGVTRNAVRAGARGPLGTSPRKQGAFPSCGGLARGLIRVWTYGFNCLRSLPVARRPRRERERSRHFAAARSPRRGPGPSRHRKGGRSSRCWWSWQKVASGSESQRATRRPRPQRPQRGLQASGALSSTPPRREPSRHCTGGRAVSQCWWGVELRCLAGR